MRGKGRGGVDAVVCARNERATIASVVRVLRRSPEVCCVIVVDDGSADQTARRARRAGATVVPGPGRGKAAAMRAGLARVHTGRVLFADADIRGLRRSHVARLARDNGGQVCGLRDNGSCWFGPFPPVTGERCLPAAVARHALRAASGYGAEVALDAAVGALGLPAATFRMRGVRNPSRAPLRRAGQVLRASARHVLGLLQYAVAWTVTAIGGLVWG